MSRIIQPAVRAAIIEAMRDALVASEDVALRFGVHRKTAITIARAAGVAIRKRGQPAIGIPTCYEWRHPGFQPFRPRGRAPLVWAQ